MQININRLSLYIILKYALDKVGLFDKYKTNNDFLFYVEKY